MAMVVLVVVVVVTKVVLVDGDDSISQALLIGCTACPRPRMHVSATAQQQFGDRGVRQLGLRGGGDVIG